MAKNSIDLEKIKQRAAELGKRAGEVSKSWHKKLGYLSDSVSRSGLEGVQLWFKSQGQIDALEVALAELVANSQSDEFSLLHVNTTLTSFTLPDEDTAQADWFLTAHNYLVKFEKNLIENDFFDVKTLQAALKELRFIAEADEFHHRYHLETIQQQVTQLYQTLQQRLADFKSLESEKIQLKTAEEQRAAAQLEADKAAALAKKEMLENVKLKEKRLAIMEEKKRRIAEKELLEAETLRQMKQAELDAKQAELTRQAKLQDAYLDLQFEEKINQWDLAELMEKLRLRISAESLSDEQKQVVTAFVDFAKNEGII